MNHTPIRPSDEPIPLNAIRVFLVIARERSVTRAATVLDITQSAASRHLGNLESWLGATLVQRRGRTIELTEYGRLFFESVADTYDNLAFSAERMRRADSRTDGLVVRTSLPTFAYSTLIPNLPAFSKLHGGAVIDIVTSLTPPQSSDQYDILITRDQTPREASNEWNLHDEQLVCVGERTLVAASDLQHGHLPAPILTVTSRPDILPRWINALGLRPSALQSGARYDHHYLAIPAAATGQGLLVVPEILVLDLLQQGMLVAVPGSRVQCGAQYRAFVVDRARNFELARAFCRWLAAFCKQRIGPAPVRASA